MYSEGLIVAGKSASRDRGWCRPRTRRRSLRGVPGAAAVDCSLFADGPTDVLPGSFDVEAIDTPEHRPIQRCDHRPVPDRVGVDIWRRLGDLR